MGAQGKESLRGSELLRFSTALLYTTSRNIQFPLATLAPEFSLMLVFLLCPIPGKQEQLKIKHPGAVKAETTAYQP